MKKKTKKDNEKRNKHEEATMWRLITRGAVNIFPAGCWSWTLLGKLLLSSSKYRTDRPSPVSKRLASTRLLKVVG